MTTGAWIFVGMVGVSGMYILGTTLIDAYFRRKARFVDDLYGKTKGNTNGKRE